MWCTTNNCEDGEKPLPWLSAVKVHNIWIVVLPGSRPQQISNVGDLGGFDSIRCNNHIDTVPMRIIWTNIYLRLSTSCQRSWSKNELIIIRIFSWNHIPETAASARSTSCFQPASQSVVQWTKPQLVLHRWRTCTCCTHSHHFPLISSFCHTINYPPTLIHTEPKSKSRERVRAAQCPLLLGIGTLCDNDQPSMNHHHHGQTGALWGQKSH